MDEILNLIGSVSEGFLPTLISSKYKSNDQELIQSNHTSYPQIQKGMKIKHRLINVQNTYSKPNE